MHTKYIFLLWIVTLWTIIMYIILGWYIPFWFDHGIYRHLVQVVAENKNIFDSPLYLRQQYEPFSGVVFYVLWTYTHSEYLYSFWYIILYWLIGLSVCFIGKKNNTYTLWSAVWFSLFIVSMHQYHNFYLGFWKQMIATLTLLLFIKYQKKTVLSIVFIITTISLHRLTWFICITYILFNYFSQKDEQYIRRRYLLYCVWILWWILPYMHYDFFMPLIGPLLKDSVSDYFFHNKYGSGRNNHVFFSHMIPLILITIYAVSMLIKKNLWSNSVMKIIKNPIILLIIFLVIFVFLRWEGHTRIRTFLDLFIIICFAGYLYRHISIYIIYWLLLFYGIYFVDYFIKNNHPYFSREDHTIMREIGKSIQDDESLFVFGRDYFGSISAHTHREAFTPNQGVKIKDWRPEEKNKIYYDSEALCSVLSDLPWKVSVFVWKNNHIYTSTIWNNCLELKKEFLNKMKLYDYVWIK